MTGPASSTPINIELMLADHLPDECERVRRLIADAECQLVQLRNRLATLEAIGRAAGVATDYQIMHDAPLERVA